MKKSANLLTGRARAIQAYLWTILALFTTSLPAASFLYSFEGEATGSAGAVSFTNAAFTIRLLANSANVSNLSPGFYSVTGSPPSISIAGVGQGSFTTPKRVFVYQPALAAGFGVGPNGADQLDLQHPDLGTYDLKSAFGPVSVPQPSYLLLVADPSTLGPITFSSVANLSFDAAVAQPTLSITRNPPFVILRWTTNAVGYELQSASRPAPVPVWTTVTNEIIVIGSENTVSVPAVGAPKFFRLSK